MRIYAEPAAGRVVIEWSDRGPATELTEAGGARETWTVPAGELAYDSDVDPENELEEAREAGHAAGVKEDRARRAKVRAAARKAGKCPDCAEAVAEIEKAETEKAETEKAAEAARADRAVARVVRLAGGVA